MSKLKHGSTDYTKTFTVAAADANGLADDVAYDAGGFALTANDMGDDCSHTVTILGNAATNHSGKTFTATGTNANGVAVTTSVAGPNGVASVSFPVRLKTVTSVTVDSTTGADTFDIGWAADACTPWVPLNYLQRNFSVGVGVVLVSGSANYSLMRTYDDIETSAARGVTDGTMVTKTATSDVGIVAPIKAVKLVINSHTSGVLRFNVLQGNS